ncbi:hypothetical protein SGLAD_v1c06210 [Spiroplasma gladiatoris]|uniref:Uncharacterized protein n=1 Tax=Spiroplasma gladiatoris TaxID=2143 RepID=A0A4P7AJU3_9MOLU|nr:hypothetical protein [Spiroplasma gladiatoris]QBQ07820.1 hypothetical protein SGLAD_v1c06210 [Spiroplasma gladiatoris]
MIQGTAKLELQKANKKLKIITNKFEKTSLDTYLIASLLLNETNEKNSNNFIESLTGKGSMYYFLLDLYKDMKNRYTKEDLQKIINQSLIPVKMIHPLTFNYYLKFNITEFNNEIFEGEIFKDEQFLSNIFTKNEEYVRSDYDGIDEVEIIVDNYDFIIQNSTVKIRINNRQNKYIEIDKQTFEQSIENNKNLDISGFTINEFEDNEKYNLLSQKDLDSLKNRLIFSIDGNSIVLYDDFVKVVKIYEKFNNYWIIDKSFDYSDKIHQKLFENLLLNIYEKNLFNEIKNKTIIKLLNISNDLVLNGNIINKILSIKSSVEIAKLGLEFIVKNTNIQNINWDIKSLEEMFKILENIKELASLYKINSNLDYSFLQLFDLNNYDKNLLINEHKNLLNKQLNDITKIKEEIYLLIGQMSQSGMREEIKKLDMKDEKLKKLRKFYNKYIAHKKYKKNNVDLSELLKSLNYIKENKKIHDIYLNKIKK